MFLKKRSSFIKKSLAAARGEARGEKLGRCPKPRIRNFFEKKFLMDLQKT
jgi:hypothetical protein